MNDGFVVCNLMAIRSVKFWKFVLTRLDSILLALLSHKIKSTIVHRSLQDPDLNPVAPMWPTISTYAESIGALAFGSSTLFEFVAYTMCFPPRFISAQVSVEQQRNINSTIQLLLRHHQVFETKGK